ncbi:MAG: 50S ribosomal protein L35ae [Nanoarchaeota archaeon]
MDGKVISFRRGMHKYKPRHFIIQIIGIGNKETAKKLVGRKVIWTSPSGKKIEGTISNLHGSKGLMRAIFEKGLPGQALNDKIKIEEKVVIARY